MNEWNVVNSNTLVPRMWAKRSNNPNYKFVWINLLCEDEEQRYCITVFNNLRNAFDVLRVEKTL